MKVNDGDGFCVFVSREITKGEQTEVSLFFQGYLFKEMLRMS